MAEIIKDGTAEYKVISMTSTMQELEDKILNKLNDKLLALFPIGTIIETTNHVSPAEYIGGTWEAMEAGRVLVSAGTASTGTVFTAGATGGEEKHTLTTGELPKTNVTISGTTSTNGAHTHGFADSDDSGGHGGCVDGNDNSRKYTISTDSAGAHSHTFSGTGTFGGGDSHNNLPPYTVIYRWRRTA